MPSQGPNSPATLADDTSFGGFSWTNPGNASSSNNSYAESAVSGFPSETDTFYLKATDFGFSIPGGATIDGILVEIEKSESTAADDVIDRRVRIVKGGTIGSTDKADATEWPTTDAYTSYGGAADLWGETWTPADINASNFGTVIAAGCASTGPGIPLIDHIRITVTYTAGADVAKQKAIVVAAAQHSSWTDE